MKKLIVIITPLLLFSCSIANKRSQQTEVEEKKEEVKEKAVATQESKNDKVISISPINPEMLSSVNKTEKGVEVLNANVTIDMSFYEKKLDSLTNLVSKQNSNLSNIKDSEYNSEVFNWKDIISISILIIILFYVVRRS